MRLKKQACYFDTSMPKIDLPDSATDLWRWMFERRVTLAELAKLVECTSQHLSDIRRGVRRPSDPLKIKIAEQTIAMERAQGVPASKARGVPTSAWFAAPTSKGAAS